MKYPLSSSLALRLLFLAGIVGPAAHAQEEATPDSLAERRQREIEGFPSNIKVGELKLDASQSLEFEDNDNVRLSDSQRQSDAIFRPIFNLNSLYPVGQMNLLRFNVGLGYEKYFRYGAYDRFVVSPGSALSCDLFVGDYRINFHDRFSYEMDPGRLAGVSGTASYGGFDNTLGASVEGALDKIVSQFSYDYEKFISTEQQFDYISRDTHSASLHNGYVFVPGVTAGLEVGASPTYYKLPLVNDNVGYFAGAYADWQLGEHFHVEPRVGYSYFTFSDSLLYKDLPSLGSYYFGVNLQHQLRPNIGYSLDAGRDTENGAYGSIQELTHVSFNPSLNILYKLRLYTGFFYQVGQDKYGTLADDFSRWGCNLGAERKLSDKLTVRLDYRLVLKDSIQKDRDYSQDRIILTLHYRF